MGPAPGQEKTLSAQGAARAVGISKNTLLRWLKQGKVPEVARDRNGWRIFGRRDVEAVAAFARKTTPPAVRQGVTPLILGADPGGERAAGSGRGEEAA